MAMEQLKGDGCYFKVWLEYRELVDEKEPDIRNADSIVKIRQIDTDEKNQKRIRYFNTMYEDLQDPNNYGKVVIHQDDRTPGEYEWRCVRPNDLEVERAKEDGCFNGDE